MPGEDLLLPLTDHALPLRDRFIPHHDGKGLDRPGLSCPQLCHRFFVGRIAAEMKTSDSFDRRDPALGDDPARPCDRLSPPHGLFAGQIDLRPALIAAHGLRVIAPARRGVILLSALRTHGKHLHAGPFSVIRQCVQDRQTRSAAGAVDERMQIPSVRRIIELRLALLADRDIRRDEDFPLCFGALDDLEGVKRAPRIVHSADIHLEDRRTFRGLFLQQVHKILRLLLASLCEDLHIGPFVADRARDSRSGRVARDRGAKTYPLYYAVYFDSQCSCRIFDHNLPDTAKWGRSANPPSKYRPTKGIMTGSAMIMS